MPFQVRNLPSISFHAAVMALSFTTMMGCGSADPTDAEQVSVAVANLSEAALDRESFESFFVVGMAPRESDRPRYRKYFYEMDSPKVSGETATADVQILDADGDVVGEREWSFSKVDDRWKISTAHSPERPQLVLAVGVRNTDTSFFLPAACIRLGQIPSSNVPWSVGVEGGWRLTFAVALASNCYEFLPNMSEGWRSVRSAGMSTKCQRLIPPSRNHPLSIRRAQ